MALLLVTPFSVKLSMKKIIEIQQLMVEKMSPFSWAETQVSDFGKFIKDGLY